MGLILRIDVDKPYGNNNLFKKIISKLREDFYFPVINKFGYLKQVQNFAILLHNHSVPAIFYFRNCTAPSQSLIQWLETLGHSIGFHAENTKSFETFETELKDFKSKTGLKKLHSFTKHESGVLKLGKNHHPPYEEEKYKGWAMKTETPFYFGNGEMSTFIVPEDKSFYPEMFWIEAGYRDLETMSIEKLISEAKNEDYPLLIHPENYYARQQTKFDFDKLLRLSKQVNVNWFVPPMHY
ncbi:MAG: hypothetical protein LW825_04475 [Candidatus Jidaibacter sp.]|jgi:hypothetical protein|nr:hypothetical protein [Candidatus Jidaibacter sp.]